MTTKHLRRYYTLYRPWSSAGCIISGALLLAVGAVVPEKQYLLMFAGLLLVVGGIVNIWRVYQTITDTAVDTHCRQLADSCYTALCKDARESGLPVEDGTYTHDYLFENLFQERLSRRGKDRRMRSSIYEAQCFLFLQDGLIIYRRCRWSLLSAEQVTTDKRFYLTELCAYAMEQRNSDWFLIMTLPDFEKIRVYCGSNPDAMPLVARLRESGRQYPRI